MTNEQQHSSIETRLLALYEVERAGVFARTPVDAELLLAAGLPARVDRPIPLFRRLAPLVTAAAVLGIAFCGWAFRMHRPSEVADGTTPSAGDRPAMLQTCMAGPGESLRPGCDAFDYDNDGYVSLTDASIQQVAAADVTR